MPTGASGPFIYNGVDLNWTNYDMGPQVAPPEVAAAREAWLKEEVAKRVGTQPYGPGLKIPWGNQATISNDKLYKGWEHFVSVAPNYMRMVGSHYNAPTDPEGVSPLEGGLKVAGIVGGMMAPAWMPALAGAPAISGTAMGAEMGLTPAAYGAATGANIATGAGVGGLTAAGVGTPTSTFLEGMGVEAFTGMAPPVNLAAGLPAATGAMGAEMGLTPGAYGAAMGATGGGMTTAELAGLGLKGLGIATQVILSKAQAGDINEAARIQAGAMGDVAEMQARQFAQMRDDLQEGVRTGLITLDKANEAATAYLTGGYEEARNVLQEAYAPFTDPWAFNLAREYLEDPSKVETLPGYEWQREQGMKALGQIEAKRTGGGLTGQGIKEAERFGQEFAATKIDEALARLMPFANLGVTSATGLGTAISGLSTEEANRLAGVTERLGISRANLGINLGTQLANITGQTIPLSTQNILGQAGIQSDAIAAGSNVGTNLANLISGQLAGTGEYFMGKSAAETEWEREKDFRENLALRYGTFSGSV